jgi:cohesin loading factor subunit SCC2
MVREAAVDLLGKFILHNQDLITQYYKIITDRILVREHKVRVGRH